MCLAIFRPPNTNIEPASLQQGWVRNSDGAGIAYIKRKKIVIVKGLMTLKEFSTAYDEVVKKNAASPMLIHFRIRSLGDRGPEHTHPYEFKHGALIHNGTLYGTKAVYGVGKSDTELFTEQFGDDLTFDNVSKHKDEFGKAIDYNKIALLYKTGEHVILNEEKGEWHEGVWFSNSAYKVPDRSRTTYYGTDMYE